MSIVCASLVTHHFSKHPPVCSVELLEHPQQSPQIDRYRDEDQPLLEPRRRSHAGGQQDNPHRRGIEKVAPAKLQRSGVVIEPQRIAASGSMRRRKSNGRLSKTKKPKIAVDILINATMRPLRSAPPGPPGLLPGGGDGDGDLPGGMAGNGAGTRAARPRAAASIATPRWGISRPPRGPRARR